jgi:hypothetical protein
MKYPQVSPARRSLRIPPASGPHMPAAAIWTSEHKLVASQPDAFSCQGVNQATHQNGPAASTCERQAVAVGKPHQPGGAKNHARIDIARWVQRFVSALSICLFACTPTVATAQTIQCQSMVLTNSSPCDTGRCLLTRWVATVPPSQTLTYAVELSTNRLTWQESTIPITLTESAIVEVWVTANSSIGFIRLRIVL